MQLKGSSVRWAIDCVANHSDGDLFPRILEFEAILAQREYFIELLEKPELLQLHPGPSRRFIVPKDEISYRQATQLDPQDSIILSALLFQYGQGIEDRRLDSKIVFSYRFGPSGEHGLYSSQSAWNEFWDEAKDLAERSSAILYCDIADFYNQIYHHTIENQLIASGFPNQAVKWIRNLLGSTTADVSRGVPVGPHSVHLLAEAALIPIDNTLASYGFTFRRFADDILIFCDSREQARSVLARVASVLDKQQRLTLQRHKTRIFSSDECLELCNKMIEDRPINSHEKEMLAIVRKYSGGDPYKLISYETVKPKDWKRLTEKKITSIIDDYTKRIDTDYIRLRWFYRRLTQIGHPGAMRISLKKIRQLGPCFANICSYFASVQTISPKKWKKVGEKLLMLLETHDVKDNEFFRLSILSLFTRNAYLNHFPALASQFGTSDPYARREIILAGYKNGAVDWLREHKETFEGMDPWQKRAFLLGCSQFPPDERKFFLRRRKLERPFEMALCKWAMVCSK